MLSIVKSVPDSPMVPSIFRVAPDVRNEKNVQVLVATALAPVMLLMVSTPPEEAGAKVALQASVTNRVLPERAVSGLAGCVPS